MKILGLPAAFLLILISAACVTINVYFPAAVAERVADQFVQDVYGPATSPPPATTPSPAPRSSWDGAAQFAIAALNLLIPAAHAQADFDASSPAIQKIKASLQERHKALDGFYSTGAIGLTRNGEIAVRDLNTVPLPQRNLLRKLVADENAERAALYREIATANGRPEWEPEIRSVFAERWIANARAGWYYQNDKGDWVAK